MNYLILISSVLLLQGCLYFNDRGVSAHLYDDCHSYYDADGNYFEECDGNIIDYKEAKEGMSEIKKEISDHIKTRFDQPCTCTKERVEPNPCACK